MWYQHMLYTWHYRLQFGNFLNKRGTCFSASPKHALEQSRMLCTKTKPRNKAPQQDCSFPSSQCIYFQIFVQPPLKSFKIWPSKTCTFLNFPWGSASPSSDFTHSINHHHKMRTDSSSTVLFSITSQIQLKLLVQVENPDPQFPHESKLAVRHNFGRWFSAQKKLYSIDSRIIQHSINLILFDLSLRINWV